MQFVISPPTGVFVCLCVDDIGKQNGTQSDKCMQSESKILHRTLRCILANLIKVDINCSVRNQRRTTRTLSQMMTKRVTLRTRATRTTKLMNSNHKQKTKAEQMSA